jgi:hypothetical protein
VRAGEKRGGKGRREKGEGEGEKRGSRGKSEKGKKVKKSD